MRPPLPTSSSRRPLRAAARVAIAAAVAVAATGCVGNGGNSQGETPDDAIARRLQKPARATDRLWQSTLSPEAMGDALARLGNRAGSLTVDELGRADRLPGAAAGLGVSPDAAADRLANAQHAVPTLLGLDRPFAADHVSTRGPDGQPVALPWWDRVLRRLGW